MTETADPDVDLVTVALRSLRQSALRCRRAHIVLDHRDAHPASPSSSIASAVPVASGR